MSYGLFLPVNDENDFWYASEGGWQPALQTLIRWLFDNHYDEYANPLQDEARSVSDVGEAVALNRLHETLAWLRNEPPKGLSSEQHKELRELRDKAHKLVLYGRRLAQPNDKARKKAMKGIRDKIFVPKGKPGRKNINAALVSFAQPLRKKGMTYPQIVEECRKRFPNRNFTESMIRKAFYDDRKKMS
jgi:hypothetical protein